jgi:predicted transcriptional regulator
MKKCKHINVERHDVTRYIIPKGYDWANNNAIDFKNFFIEENQDRIVCEDCGEILD